MVKWLERVVSLFYAPQANNPLDDRFYDLPNGALSRSGVRVSPDTAMKVSAVYRCVSILSNVLAMFPKGMYERLDRGRRGAPEHPLDPLISFKPNQRQTAFEFWRQVCFNLVLRQNAYVQILPGRPGRGWVGGLIPLHPDRVRGPEELPDGRLRYEYTRPDGQKVPMMGGLEMWHISGLSSDGLKGMSMTDVATDSFGLSIAAERHASRFFERGVKPQGVLHHERTLKPETAQAMSEAFGRSYGGEHGAGRVPVLWEGMKFVPVTMTLKDAEFLDSRKFSVAEIARWFGVPPHMVGDVERSTSWGTGIEEQGLQFLVYSLLPWIELLEQSIRFTLVVQPEKFYPKFNVNAILRMNAKAQADVFSVLIDKGVLNPNECRELLERNPREGGDEYVDIAAPPPTPAQTPRPEPEPEDEPEPETVATVAPGYYADADALVAAIKAAMAPVNGEAKAAAEVAKRLTEARTSELLREEDAALVKLAKQHASDPEAWARSVASFYGRFARRVASTQVCTLLQAKEWCSARRDLALSEGGLLKLSQVKAQPFGGIHAEG